MTEVVEVGDGREAGRSIPPVPDPEAAVAFLQAQCAVSAKALRTAGAGPAGFPEPEHEAWLTLIAGVRRSDSASAELLTTLYACHGQVTGTGEQSLHPLLPAEVAARVASVLRMLVLGRLTALTEQAVEVLRAPAVACSRADGRE